MQKDTENNKNTQGAQDVQATADAEIKKPAAAVDFSGIDFEKLVNAITSAKSVKEMLPEERAEYLAAVKSYQNRLHENAAVIERLIGHPAADPKYYLQFFVNGTLKDVQSVFVGILDFYESETWRFYAGAFPDFEAWFIGINPQYENILDVAITLEYCRQLEAAQPFALEETEAYKKRTGTETVPFSAFMKDILPLCLEKKKDSGAPRIKAGKISTIDYPTDKVNRAIWKTLDAESRGDDGFFHIAVEREGSKKQIDILYNIDFAKKEEQLESGLRDVNNLPALTARTKRVMIAANELYKNSRSGIFSKTQLYHAMGYTGTPGESDQIMIESELNLLLSVMSIDNAQEVDAGYKYARFKYTGAIMPHERVRTWINGKLTTDAIHLFRQPPLMEFAENRGQITTVKAELLNIGRNKNVQTMAIEDYLLTRIARMKDAKKKKKALSNKILYETVFSNCALTEKKQKQRAKGKITDILNHYKEQGYIKGFSIAKQKDGINIII